MRVGGVDATELLGDRADDELGALRIEPDVRILRALLWS